MKLKRVGLHNNEVFNSTMMSMEPNLSQLHNDDNGVERMQPMNHKLFLNK